MKHYLETIPSLLESTGRVKVLSPFNGKVIDLPDDGSRGKQVWIRARGKQWVARFFHADPVPSVVVGKKVKAGQLIGHAVLAGGGANFDIALEKWGRGSRLMDSIFLHLSRRLARTFAARGLTPAATVVPKAQRDADPCSFGDGGSYDDPSNWAKVTG